MPTLNEDVAPEGISIEILEEPFFRGEPAVVHEEDAPTVGLEAEDKALVVGGVASVHAGRREEDGERWIQG